MIHRRHMTTGAMKGLRSKLSMCGHSTFKGDPVTESFGLSLEANAEAFLNISRSDTNCCSAWPELSLHGQMLSLLAQV